MGLGGGGGVVGVVQNARTVQSDGVKAIQTLREMPGQVQLQYAMILR